jgi:hypothetical protein
VKKNEKLQAATAIALVIFIFSVDEPFQPPIFSMLISPKKEGGKLFGLFSFS